MTLTDRDGIVVCNHCEAPYVYEANLLTSEYVWVRRCKAKCKRENREQAARFEPADSNPS